MSRPETLPIVEALLLHTNDSCGELEDMKQLYADIEDAQEGQEAHDFTVEYGGAEYRFIHDDEIWDIYVEAIEETVRECYDLPKYPDFVAVSIDWEATARNCYVDGYGHQFASYDHGETEHLSWWVFRTN